MEYTFAKFLKGQLTDFVETYEKYLQKSFSATLTYTIICFIGAALLFQYSVFADMVISKQYSLFSYFFHRFSYMNLYSIVDLTKTLFIFIVSLFSIGLTRMTGEKTENMEFSVTQLFKKFNSNDIFYLCLLLLSCSILDYFLFKFGSYITIVLTL